ncbi:MAG: threonine-phosphate decarboxylase CobD [Pseudomonadota bacterium]
MSKSPAKRDHGGNLDAATTQYGGERTDWLDLSTGINPVPYPLPEISPEAWANLPTQTRLGTLIESAKQAYGTRASLIPFPGAQGVIQTVPRLRDPGHARILSPTYNEHRAALEADGWHVETVSTIRDLEGADLAVVVNPNNPDGRKTEPQSLKALAGDVGILIVDESFAETDEALSLATALSDAPDTIIVLKSFGKFYGLAGLRLGFALATGRLANRLFELAGPWPVSGPAIEIATQAFTDIGWQDATRQRLARDAERLDAIAFSAGWSLIGGTTLFRTYETPDAAAAQRALARGRVWSRVFPYSDTWLRLGLPPPDRWEQLSNAINGTY